MPGAVLPTGAPPEGLEALLDRRLQRASLLGHRLADIRLEASRRPAPPASMAPRPAVGALTLAGGAPPEIQRLPELESEEEAIAYFRSLDTEDDFGESFDEAKELLELAQENAWDDLEDLVIRYVRRVEDERDFGSGASEEVAVAPSQPVAQPNQLPQFLVADSHVPTGYDTSQLPPPGGQILGQPQSFRVNGRPDLVRLWIKCGPWQVTCYWPMNWFLTCGAPGLNQYGYLPSAEFGTPTFHGEDAGPRHDAEVVIQPFSYKNVSGQVVTPKTPAGPKGK